MLQALIFGNRWEMQHILSFEQWQMFLMCLIVNRNVG